METKNQDKPERKRDSLKYRSYNSITTSKLEAV